MPGPPRTQHLISRISGRGEEEEEEGLGPKGWSDRLLLGRMSRVTGPGRWPENIKPASGQMDGGRLRLSSRVGATLRHKPGPPTSRAGAVKG